MNRVQDFPTASWTPLSGAGRGEFGRGVADDREDHRGERDGFYCPAGPVVRFVLYR